MKEGILCITKYEFFLLYALDICGYDSTQKSLKKQVAFSELKIPEIAKKLKKRGLLKVKPKDDNNKFLRYSLTRKGCDAARQQTILIKNIIEFNNIIKKDGVNDF